MVQNLPGSIKAFAPAHICWNLEQRSKVRSTDEFRFCLLAPNCQHRVWRRAIEWYFVHNIISKLSFNSGSIMIGEVFLQTGVKPCVWDCGGNNRSEWFFKNPELIPIVHVWDIIGREVRARVHAPAILAKLFLILQEEWTLLEVQANMYLIKSVPRRKKAMSVWNHY